MILDRRLEKLVDSKGIWQEQIGDPCFSCVRIENTFRDRIGESCRPKGTLFPPPAILVALPPCRQTIGTIAMMPISGGLHHPHVRV
jgi:hypothetical protein